MRTAVVLGLLAAAGFGTSTVSAASASSRASEPLGRLFFAPEQRALLDRQRRDGHGSAATGNVIRLDGFVARGGVPSTVWINGRPQPDGGVATTVSLRVGESFDSVTREKNDVVAPGAIRVGRTAPR